ncbi:MAG TPA: L-seryl-tRNA(Sec) selenium transferase [Thermoanaerobaculia bacterium]|nr:L-seryl-tRNA(Sec) selenium transferase [Thermoanaerobaculia bacterium]
MAEPADRATLSRIPQVDRLLGRPELAGLVVEHGRPQVVAALRAQLGRLRGLARGGALDAAQLEPGAIAASLAGELAERSRSSYRRVINATGVILHTGLGRAPLSAEAVAALAATAGGAQRVELDLPTGQRGGREEGCVTLLRELVGGEDAAIVNNNAGATLLVLAALARGRRVLLSRGEMVEIGGSYRVPDVMAESGAILTEVGTTNRTRLADYERACSEEVGLILKVHTSNYRIVGFTEEASIDELVALGRQRGIPVVHDLGSGSLFDLAAEGIAGEPEVRRSVASGADVVCFSGDKLLGGPQAGVLVGRREAVGRCRRHPLFRALRPGRLVYTALEATLRLYAAGPQVARERVPALARLLAPPPRLEARARRLARRLARLPGIQAAAVPCAGQAGSGSLPQLELAGWGVRLSLAGCSADDLARRLRTGEPAVVPRIEDGAVLLDLRSVGEEEQAELVRALTTPPSAAGCAAAARPPAR